jgi:hypothetical protein
MTGDLELKIPCVYNMPCKCGQVYIEQTSCSIETRIMEHLHHIHLEEPDKSAIAKHSINLGHCIKLQDIAMLYTNGMHGSGN